MNILADKTQNVRTEDCTWSTLILNKAPQRCVLTPFYYHSSHTTAPMKHSSNTSHVCSQYNCWVWFHTTSRPNHTEKRCKILWSGAQSRMVSEHYFTRFCTSSTPLKPKTSGQPGDLHTALHIQGEETEHPPFSKWQPSGDCSVWG